MVNKTMKKAFAKVNLMLHVLNKRSDSYHNLQAINVKVNLYDEISLEESTVDLIEISDKTISTDFIQKVIDDFKVKFKIKHYYHIYIKKNIPVSAGLGGGSMDASAIIDLLDEYEKTNLSIEDKIKLFSHLGADVAYGFINQPSIVEGIGDIITPIASDKLIKEFVIVNPGINVNTKLVFGQNKKTNQELTHEEILSKIDNLDMDIYTNDLELPAFSLYPELIEVKNQLIPYGHTVMSGSGSTFVIHTDKYEAIKKQFPHYLVKKINIL